MTTNKEKEMIFSLREQGYMLKEIAEMTGKSLSLVKKYVAENNKLTADALTAGRKWSQDTSSQRDFAATNAKESIIKSILNASIRKSSKSTSVHAAAKSSLVMENHTGSFVQVFFLQEADL